MTGRGNVDQEIQVQLETALHRLVESFWMVVAADWPKQDREPLVHYSGSWMTTET